MPEKNKIIVYVELNKDKEMLSVSLEAIGIGRKLADATGGKLEAVVAGNGIAKTKDELMHYGVDAIYIADAPDFEVYQPECHLNIMTKACEMVQPLVILFGNSLTAIDLAPRLALNLNAGLITDCADIRIESGEVLCTKAVYSSNVMAEYGFAEPPCVATIRARSFEAAQRKDTASGECIAIEVGPGASANKIQWIGNHLQEDMEGIPLTSANIVVAGGRGMGGEEGFELLRSLCDTMRAALGASRPPCDLDWVSSRAQVGLTGEIVAPSLYIAVGISGSFQHIAGMNDSKVIVAINKDDRANIFKVADYGIVGEFEEIIPEFNKTMKEIM